MDQQFFDYTFRLAASSEVSMIWQIFADAIRKRKEEGSDQWQDGYPNIDVIEGDIEKDNGYVALDPTGRLVGYLALLYDGEPAYDLIDSKWLTNRPYAVVHRMAVSQQPRIKGLATWMLSQAEQISLQDGYLSLKIDTNFDNTGMLRVLEKREYVYCGIVHFRGGDRRAFEKKLDS
ncbi:MAG: GNAT family N-acetyltransferase [Sphingobacterium sp.]